MLIQLVKCNEDKLFGLMKVCDVKKGNPYHIISTNALNLSTRYTTISMPALSW